MQSWILLLIFPSLSAHSISRRILSGSGAISEAGYVVIFLNPYPFCTGTVITSFYILTAAECMKPTLRKSLHFKFGITSLKDRGTYAHPFRFYTHDSYIIDGFHLNAIGMIRTKDRMKFDPPCFEPIPLTNADVEPGEGPMVLAGWGGDGFRDVSPCLQFISNMFVISHQECNDRLRAPQWHSVEHMCAQFKGSKHKVGCRVDVGGPLVYNGMLVGILGAANASQCGHEIPDVFINIFIHLPWINQQLMKGDNIEQVINRIRPGR